MQVDTNNRWKTSILEALQNPGDYIYKDDLRIDLFYNVQLWENERSAAIEKLANDFEKSLPGLDVPPTLYSAHVSKQDNLRYRIILYYKVE